MPGRISRRKAIQTIAATGAGLYLGSCTTTPTRRTISAHDKVNIAFVGVGLQGRQNLRALAHHNVVAICDVDTGYGHVAKSLAKHPDARRFTDYRKMLDQLDKQIDAVVVCTPDHSHALISLTAMRMGKHVYCEKPLTWSLEESRLMGETAADMNVATQMGTQGMAEGGTRAGIEMLRSGVLGELKELHVWSNRPAGYWKHGIPRPAGTPTIPETLDWDLWLSTAEYRAYHPAYVPFRWRGFLDFGTGSIGDMGIHHCGLPFVGLQMGIPDSVDVLGMAGQNSESYPLWSRLRLNFPKDDHNPAFPMYWYDGGKLPPDELIGGEKVVTSGGAIIVGEKGTLYMKNWSGANWTLLPRDRFEDVTHPEPWIPRVKNHHEEWLTAIRGGPRTLCNFIDFGAKITEIMLLGSLAQKTGKSFRWDTVHLVAADSPDADPFIRRRYREGFELPSE